MENRLIIPDAPKQLMKILLDAGYEAYVVGGCVRDFCLGIVPHDWDICTNASPDAMKECFKKYHVIETGLKHGTLTVMVSGTGYEITTFRVDGNYSDHRHPDSVTFVGNLKDDLQRRDFTINALAANISGKIIDYFNGFGDLENELIRCVGNANERFQEDALRILRAMRFASRFGFAIEYKTEQAMRKNAELLKHISAERVNKELSGILMGDCYTVLRCFPDILSTWIPEVEPCVGFWQRNPHHYKDVWNHTVSAIDDAPKDLYVRLALLYHDLGKPQCFTMENGIGHFYGHAAVSKAIAENSLRNLKFDNKTIEIVTQLVEAHDRTIEPRKSVIRRCLNKYGKMQFIRLVWLKVADKAAQMPVEGEQPFSVEEIFAVLDEIESQKDCFILKNLAVNGHDLMEAGIPAGERMGHILNKLLDEVMGESVENNKEKLLERAKEIFNNE